MSARAFVCTYYVFCLYAVSGNVSVNYQYEYEWNWCVRLQQQQTQTDRQNTCKELTSRRTYTAQYRQAHASQRFNQLMCERSIWEYSLHTRSSVGIYSFKYSIKHVAHKNFAGAPMCTLMCIVHTHKPHAYMHTALPHSYMLMHVGVDAIIQRISFWAHSTYMY